MPIATWPGTRILENQLRRTKCKENFEDKLISTCVFAVSRQTRNDVAVFVKHNKGKARATCLSAVAVLFKPSVLLSSFSCGKTSWGTWQGGYNAFLVNSLRYSQKALSPLVQLSPSTKRRKSVKSPLWVIFIAFALLPHSVSQSNLNHQDETVRRCSSERLQSAPSHGQWL